MDSRRDFLEAVKAGDLESLKEMIEEDVSLLGARTELGVSAILLAIYYGKNETAEYLSGESPQLDVFEASAAGRLERVRDLLAGEGDLANAYSSDGFQPLGLASFFGHPPVVELLLGHGAAVNSASRNSQHVMPLHGAVAHRHTEIARRLIEHGADVNAEQKGGFTPLQEAAHSGQLEMAQLLLDHGANVSSRNAAGKSALDLALEQDHKNVARILRQSP